MFYCCLFQYIIYKYLQLYISKKFSLTFSILKAIHYIRLLLVLNKVYTFTAQQLNSGLFVTV